MSQLTSIVSKNNKSEIKKDKNIQCTQSYYEIPRRSDLKIPCNYIIFICTDLYTQFIKKLPTYFFPIVLYIDGHDYRLSVHNPRWKHHHKILTHVTPLCHTTLHTKIHLYALVHKSLPRKPVIWHLIHFLRTHTQTRKPAIWTSLHSLHAYIIFTQT